MIKALKYFITAALAIIAFTGCSNEDNNPDISGKKDSPTFTATIGSGQARAYDESWESGDRIGISDGNRTNVCYLTTQGDGNFTVETYGDQIYFQDDNEVAFTAYYPWNTLEEEAGAINADTRDQTGHKNFDFLWARSTGKKENPSVTFKFAHRMAKVVLTVKLGNGVIYDELKASRLSLDGLLHKGKFNISDGGTTIADGSEGQWAFSDVAPATETESSITYSIIVFPQVLRELLKFTAELPGNNTLRAEIDFSNANSAIDGTDAKNELVAGRQYNLSVTLHKSGVSLDKCVINPWEDVNKSIDVD